MAASAHLPASGAMARLAPEITGAVRLAILLGVAGALGPFCLVVLKSQIYSLVVPTGSMATAWGLVAGFTIASVALVAVSHLRDLALLALGNRVARRLAPPVLQAAAGRPGVDPAQAAAQALRDVEEVRRGVAGPLCSLALDAVLVPLLLLLLAVFHWAFAVFALVTAVLALGLGLLTERWTRTTLAEANLAATRGSALVADSVRCAEAVEAMGMLPSLVRRWAGTLARGTLRLRSAQASARLAAAATTTLYGIGGSGALVVGVLLTINGADIGYGLLAGLLLTGRLMEPFGQVGHVLDDMAAGRAAWLRLDTLLREADAAAPRESRAWPCPEGRLSVERVTLVHPGTARPLLHDVTMDVGPGEVVALLGPPGSGKSTLLRLMLGVQQPTAGRIFLDGHATAQWDREDLARHIGYLPQDPALPGGTVAEAIARLQPRPEMAAVIRAARLAGAERMIAEFPQGFATPLGGTLQLSMGQRQRIALARAIFGAPRLVLLDEPAAYLDAEGEAAVLRMIAALAMAGTAVIFTSHREALVAAAGRRVALRGGTTQALPAPARVAALPGPSPVPAGLPARLTVAA